MKKVVVITYGYPNPATPTLCAFLKELVLQWRKMGVDIEVINPLTIKNYRQCKGNASINEHYPLYNSFSLIKHIPFLRRLAYIFADNSFQRATEKVLELLDDGNCILYAHFLNAGYVAARIGIKKKMKVFCAFGESDLWSIKGKSRELLRRYLNCVDGFISVSSENNRILLKNQFTTQSKILFAPNGVDLSSFEKKDKMLCRRELGFPIDKKIGIFIGHFIDRKGPLRVEKATESITNLRMIYVGTGPQKPTGSNVLFCGPVKHEELSMYLGAADFFVLPTRAEGCCNSILEAMACGLPIISSDGTFNDDILSSEYSIRIKPDEIDNIKRAIEIIINDSALANSMSDAAIVAAQKFDIRNRAKNILSFITQAN